MQPSSSQQVKAGPSIQATPQNPLLGLLAKALYKARDVLSPAEGSLAQQKGFNIADFVIGDAPEEVENWSYGSNPLMLPQMTRVPQFKTTVIERDGQKTRQSRAGPALDAVAFAPFGALDNLAGGMAKGAIRVGGREDLVASHAMHSLRDEMMVSRADNGLFAPSIGLHTGGNDYAPFQPAFVWRAGALDRPFPDSAPASIYNRDAYVWNPDFNQYRQGRSIVDQWEAERPDMKNRFARVAGDARLTQMDPGGVRNRSQTAAIMASPNFGSLAEWENSPFGAGLLTSNGKAINEYKFAFDSMFGQKLPDEEVAQMIERFQEFGPLARKLPGSALQGSKMLDMYQLASEAPSAMGELKLYAPSVGVEPQNAVIWDPQAGLSGKSDIFPAGGLMRDLGYQIYGPLHLAGLAGYASVASNSVKEMPLHLLAPSSGQLPPSAEEAARMYQDLQTKGSSMVGASGLKTPAQPFDQLVSHAEKSWTDPADPTEGLWPVVKEWFQGGPDFTLVSTLKTAYGLSPEQTKALQAIWDEAETGVQGAKDMQQWLLDQGITKGQPAPIPDLYPELSAPAETFGFPPGHPAIAVFQNPQKASLADLAVALGAKPYQTYKKTFSEIGKALGMTEEESMAILDKWMHGMTPAAVLFKEALK